MNRAETIYKWIEGRKVDGQKPISCIFYITVPNLLENITEDKTIKNVVGILNKYNIEWNIVDTVPGSFNLNRDWIETSDINCYIEYCGCYPVEWDIDDVTELESLEYEGKIIIKVLWHQEDGTYVQNN